MYGYRIKTENYVVDKKWNKNSYNKIIRNKIKRYFCDTNIG